MLQPYSVLNVADNSGARYIRIIQPLKPAAHDRATIGDVVVCSVRRANPHGVVKEHEIVKAVIVRQAHNFRRSDGTVVRFDDNAAVIINNDGTPIGTRVLGPVTRELRERGFPKIISLAEEVI